MTDTIRDAAEALLAAMDGATGDFADERAALRKALDAKPTSGVLSWDLRTDGRYFAGLHLGSTDENGRHLRDASGWPFSIYVKAREIGVGDMVLCHGIQHEADARAIHSVLNAMVLRS